MSSFFPAPKIAPRGPSPHLSLLLPLSCSLSQAAADAVAAAAFALSSRRQSALASLPPEPPASPGPSSSGGAVTLAIRLPEGARAGRRFAAGSTVADAYAFVDSLEGVPMSYQLVASFPRRAFPRLEGGVALAEAGLAPQAALFVEAMDDDE